MATMNTNANLNVKVNGVNELDKLKGKITNLTSGFNSLKTALTGLAFTQIIGGALRTADAIVDLSEATGMAIPAIEGFKKSVISFGVSSEGAEKGILKLVNAIGEAAGGSAELQYYFGQVGVSVNDLASLTEQEIFDKVISGLSNVNSASERSLIVTALLGKEFRGLSGNTEALAAAYAKSRDEAAKNEAATRNAAAAYDKLQESLAKFGTALTLAISPITEFLSNLDSTKLQEFANEIVALATIAGGLFVFSKIATAISEMSIAIAAARAGTLALSAVFLKATIIGAGVALAIGAILSALKLFTDIDLLTPIKNGVGKAIDFVKDLFGFKPDETLKTEMDKQAAAAEKNAESNKKAGQTVREVVDPFKNLKEQVRGTADEFARLNKQNLEGINLQTQLIGKSREEQELRKSEAEIARKAAEEIKKLEDQKAKLTKEQKAAGIGGDIDIQIAKIKEQQAIDTKATEQAIKNSQERTRAYDLEKFTKQSQIDVENNLKRIQDDIAKSTMTEIQRKEYDILAAARDRADAEIRAEEARRGSLLTDQEKLKYYEAAKNGTNELIAKEQELYDKSRLFSTGWTKAFQEYSDNAKNAAAAAERIFQKATQGMEDMIVNFAKTGKLEFKSFVNSMLEELLRSQIRQVMSQILTIGGGTGKSTGGTLFGAIGDFLGFANGGVIPTNEPVLVGERGPELLMGAAGRQVVPNEKLGTTTQVTYNINAVDASSFKSMVAADPSFIHAVAMQGAKSVPGRR